MKQILLLLLFSFLASSQFISGYEYHLFANDTSTVLDPEGNNFYVIGFSGSNCADCFWQQYVLALSVYHFEIYDDVVIANANTADVPELSSFCDVDIDSARVEFRIVYPHATHCVEYDYDSDGRIPDWISNIIGRSSRISYVKELNGRDAIHKYVSDPNKAYFYDFFIPGNEACYTFSLDVERIAESFALEPLIKFIRIDCSNNIRLCEDEYNITHFPSYRFITPQIYHSRKATLTKATPFAFIDFIDQKLDLHRTLGGGLDPQFGREPAIDEQIDAFIEGDELKRKAIMRDVYLHRKTYRNSATYYKVMKEYIKSGPKGVDSQINATESELAKLYVDDNAYPLTKSKLNILYRFQEINPNRTVILNANNYDRVVCHDRDFFVLFYDIQCEECREFSSVYRELFKRRGWRHGFAAINAATNGHIRDRLNIDTHPEIRWYPKHCDPYISFETVLRGE